MRTIYLLLLPQTTNMIDVRKFAMRDFGCVAAGRVVGRPFHPHLLLSLFI